MLLEGLVVIVFFELLTCFTLVQNRCINENIRSESFWYHESFGHPWKPYVHTYNKEMINIKWEVNLQLSQFVPVGFLVRHNDSPAISGKTDCHSVRDVIWDSLVKSTILAVGLFSFAFKDAVIERLSQFRLYL